MTIDEYRNTFDESDAVGWMAIDAALKNIYSEQEPRHYPSALPPMMSPLAGISFYDHDNYKYCISYGMSELFYNENAIEKEYSKWGFEFTARVESNGDEDDPKWLIDLMYKLADYVYKSGRWFEPYHLIPLQNFGIVSMEMKAVAFDIDSELGTIETPHGQVIFLQILALNHDQFSSLGGNPTTNDVKQLINVIKKENPLLIMKDFKQGK